MQNLSENISTILQQKGASLVGFANIEELPLSIRKDFSYAISIAVALHPKIIDEIRKGPTTNYYNEYKRINTLLSQLCETAEKILLDHGFATHVIEPTTENFDPKTLSAPFQHKTIATSAGIGWVGKSALLITKQFGAAVRLATVLTDAELTCGKPVEKSYCGTCDECIIHCPVKAIIGNNWWVGVARDELFNASLCRKNCKELSRKEAIPSTICGICINACPWTQKYIKK